LPIRDAAMMRILLLLLLALGLASTPCLAAPSDFPRPTALEEDVRFWIRIYTEVGTDGGLIHDSRDLAVVYEKILFPSNISSRSRERRVEKQKKSIASVLRRLGQGKRTKLSQEEERILALWPKGVSNSTLNQAAKRLRFQLGQADKFRAGLIRSGEWVPHIRSTLKDMGLPMEIAALPHVESSFTPHAYSRVGAAGLWQFTRSTGRRFMRIDHVVDERLDPFKASGAAARLLQQNYQVTGSWPLAITAYNHGASGMRRAANKLGTRDITTVLRKYKSRTFGFASRNFYVEFLAAVDIASNPERYFGKLTQNPPVAYATTEVPYYTKASALSRSIGVSTEVLKQSNLSLLSTVWREAKYVPRGFTLRVPRSAISEPLAQLVARVPSSQRHASQTRDLYYTVRRGDNLSSIARRNDSTISELMALNGLRSRHRIRAGQRLRLPHEDHGVQVASAPRRSSTPSPPPSDGMYTVRRGDTLTRISDKFGVSEQQILAMNALHNRNYIEAGQVLRVTPVSETKAAAPVTVAKAEPAKISRPATVEPKASLATEETAAEVEALASEAAPPLVADATPITGPAAEVEGVEPTPPLSDDAEAEEAELKAALLADPSDYSVGRDDSIEVQATETLGHYADWLGIRTSRLRDINHLSYGAALDVHHRVKLDFSRVTPEEFERKRMEYHRSLQAEFFESYEIAGTREHVIRRGDSLWTLSQRKYRVPIWLIRQYNPDLDFESLTKGTRVTVPELKRRSAAPSETRTS